MTPETFCTPDYRGIDVDLDEWRADSQGYESLGSRIKPNLYDYVYLQRFARCESEDVELLIGGDIPKKQLENVKEMISKNGGRVTSAISTREDIKAVTVLVPIKDAYFFAHELLKNGLVKYVEPNFRVKAFFTPNDPYWPDQWGPKKIEADFAWNTTVGSSDVIVAIIDTGIDYTHPDLAANYAPLGLDWVNNDTDPLDDNGHGTHCAGIVAAATNNSIGIAGLAQVHIMAEKALDLDGFGYYSWIIDAIYHAADAGAKIISMSFGGSDDSASVHDAIKYAYDHGVLLVAAAGNEGNSFLNYPAAYDEVIAVSATDPADNLATFSSYGMWIELAAPGVDIYSTLPTYNVTLTQDPFNKTLNYDYLSGTSMACPHVAGVAALAWSAFPDYTNYKIRQILRRTADDLGDVGFDEFYGYGRINAEKAVAGLLNHDLAISGWRHPYGLRRGEFGLFNATISNYGKSNETNVSVQFFVNQTLIDVETISSLENEASTSATFLWSTMTEGNYNVTCYVVPVSGENYTKNNVASAIVFVRPSLVLRVPSEYPTIKEALNNAVEEDMIQVEGGSYSEGQIDIFKNNVTLVAVGTVTLNGLRTKPALKIVADFVTIEGFTVKNSSCGIYVQGHDNNIIGNSIINEGTLNGYCGIHLYRAFDSVICSNTVLSIDYSVNVDVEHGILVESSSNNTISMNKASRATNPHSPIIYGKYGISLYLSSNNTVSLNNVSNLHIGIWIYISSNNNFISNVAVSNLCGIILDASPLNKLRNNTMTNNDGNFGVRLDNIGSPSNAFNDVDASNTVNGKPICYWVNRSDASVPSDAGCVVLINCRHIKLQNLTLTYNIHGALLINTKDTQIHSNNIMSNYAGWESFGAGIWMLESSNNTVSLNNISYNVEGVFAYLGVNNTITSNDIVESGKPGGTWGVVIKETSSCNVSFNRVRNTDYGAGICVSDSRNNVVSSNSIERGIIGLTISYSDNIISSNNISGCLQGISVYYETSNCIIKSNNIVACQNYAIYMMASTHNNTFFHNNFIGNTKIHFEGGSVNSWDNGYPSGGNYWSDYAGVDEKCGPNQNQFGSDGIGDTPYTINWGNKDRYPLMTPWAPKGHDVAVVNALFSKTIVGQGFSVSITIYLLNKGDYPETFNVTTYANETSITTFTNVTLTNGNSTTITFTWNTTGFAKGNYTIWAYAKPVLGEIDTANNNCTDGLVTVTWLGDLDADFDVDQFDYWHFCSAFIDYYTIHVKDPNCDFDDDCDIDQFDYWTFCSAFIDYWKVH
jgi:parallel beta-helix repeat protein